MRTSWSTFFVLIATAVMSQQAMADVVFQNATSGVGGNTALAAGGVFTPPLNGTTGADNNWEQRTTFGSSGNIFEASGEVASENAPELVTTISGLSAGASYNVFVYFWDPTSAVEDWNVRAGLSSNPGANTLFAAADSAADFAALVPSITITAAGLASSQTFVSGSAPTTVLESGRDLRVASLGLAVADLSGQIQVYVDDMGTAGTVNRRTWYDGVGHEFVSAAVPEPSAVAIIGLASLAVLIRSRRS